MAVDDLEIDIYKVGSGRPAKWDWAVCRKAGPPLKTGSVTGARQKAVDAANRAKMLLMTKQKKKHK